MTKLEKSVNIELNGNKADGTFCSVKMDVSCGTDGASLYISQYSENETKCIHVKFSKSELEEFVEALQKVL